MQLSGHVVTVHKGVRGGRDVWPVTCPSTHILSWCLSLHAPKNPHTQVYSTQCCLEELHHLKVLFKLCFPLQKRCSSELKNCDKAAYNVTYPIVYHLSTTYSWAESFRETNAPERINSVLTHYSGGQMRISISKARGRNDDPAYIGILVNFFWCAPSPPLPV